MKYAESMNYWQTTVHPAKSQAEIIELLEDFGALNYQIAQGNANGCLAWMVRFEWSGKSYRFLFVPLTCKNPDVTRSFGGKKRTHLKQSVYQMGRIAVHFTKAILTAAEAQPYALFGFMELPSVRDNGIPFTAGELDVDGVMSLLMLPMLTGGNVLEG